MKNSQRHPLGEVLFDLSEVIDKNGRPIKINKDYITGMFDKIGEWICNFDPINYPYSYDPTRDYDTNLRNFISLSKDC